LNPNLHHVSDRGALDVPIRERERIVWHSATK
jgi:hypothetical protein